MIVILSVKKKRKIKQNKTKTTEMRCPIQHITFLHRDTKLLIGDLSDWNEPCKNYNSTQVEMKGFLFVHKLHWSTVKNEVIL